MATTKKKKSVVSKFMSRFVKKVVKKTPPKKTVAVSKRPALSKSVSMPKEEKGLAQPRKVLTAEGYRRRYLTKHK